MFAIWLLATLSAGCYAIGISFVLMGRRTRRLSPLPLATRNSNVPTSVGNSAAREAVDRLADALENAEQAKREPTNPSRVSPPAD